MGAAGSQAKRYTPSRKQIKSVLSTTSLNSNQIVVLYRAFRQIAQSEKNRLFLSEFQEALKIQSSTLARRIFTAFGMDANLSVTFIQFCKGIYLLSDRADLKSRVHFYLTIYDFDKDGMIDKTEIRELLRCCLEENENINISHEALEEVISRTFQIYDRDADGKITYEDLLEGARTNPGILNIVSFNKLFKLIPSFTDFNVCENQ